MGLSEPEFLAASLRISCQFIVDMGGSARVVSDSPFFIALINSSTWDWVFLPLNFSIFILFECLLDWSFGNGVLSVIPMAL